MRVLQVFTGPFEPGSRQHHILYLSDGLRQIGHEVMVAAEDGSLRSLINDKGIEFQQITTGNLIGLWREIHRCNQVWETDVLHAHSVMATHACLMTSVPTIATYHGVSLECYSKRKLSQFLPHIIAVSEFHRLQLFRTGRFSPDQVAVIPESLDFDGYARWVTRLEMREPLTESSDGLTLLYIPCSNATQELTHVFEASRAVACRGIPHRLLVLGTLANFREVKAHLTLINHELRYPLIRILEDEGEFPAILSHVDGVLGTGRTILEALACDKPAVCLQAGELGGIITTQNIYAIEDNRFEGAGVRSSEAIAEDMHQLLKGYWVFCRYTEQVRELARQMVDVRNVAQRMTTVYRKCIETWIPMGRSHQIWRWSRLISGMPKGSSHGNTQG